MEHKIRYVEMSDGEFWFSLDRHMSKEEFENKVREQRGYVLSVCGKPAGILRYSLFWDNTPFCNLIYIADEFQRRGFGKALLEHWERDMRSKGYTDVMTSTQSDEEAQHFYRKLGYRDCGGLILDSQPTEIFLIKSIK